MHFGQQNNCGHRTQNNTVEDSLAEEKSASA